MKNYETIKAEREEESKDRFYKLLFLIFKMCELTGFDVVDRIILRDRKTGKIWR